jgi:phage baseplate assembly protein gpV
MTGNLTHSGGSITSNGVVVHNHKHGGVQTGGGNTGTPSNKGI